MADAPPLCPLLAPREVFSDPLPRSTSLLISASSSSSQSGRNTITSRGSRRTCLGNPRSHPHRDRGIESPSHAESCTHTLILGDYGKFPISPSIGRTRLAPLWRCDIPIKARPRLYHSFYFLADGVSALPAPVRVSFSKLLRCPTAAGAKGLIPSRGKPFPLSSPCVSLLRQQRGARVPYRRTCVSLCTCTSASSSPFSNPSECRPPPLPRAVLVPPCTFSHERKRGVGSGPCPWLACAFFTSQEFCRNWCGYPKRRPAL